MKKIVKTRSYRPVGKFEPKLIAPKKGKGSKYNRQKEKSCDQA